MMAEQINSYFIAEDFTPFLVENKCPEWLSSLNGILISLPIFAQLTRMPNK